ncbi:hypothetical protein LWI28_026660 [Acer negundo]|uniref:Thaumatin-like protein n=1 Tax=Acer negundo TaxID=4023 RepID=A0AAD5JY38_ACENE|nr:hypothetical protein LWI28_026660 [Acer negundo]
MDLIFSSCSRSLYISLILFIFSREISGATFTLVNKCGYTVWPGVLGNTRLDSTGFELLSGGSRSFQVPPTCYAYDDATSTFTCTGADYTITFCPSTTSQKSASATNGSANGSPTTTVTSATNGSATGSLSVTGSSTGPMEDNALLKFLVLGGHHNPGIVCQNNNMKEIAIDKIVQSVNLLCTLKPLSSRV